MATTPKRSTPSAARRAAASPSRAAQAPAAATAETIVEVDAAAPGVVGTETTAPEASRTDALRDALRERVAADRLLRADAKTRLKPSLAFADRAEKAFSAFKLSRKTPEERAARTYLDTGDDLGRSIRDIARRGAVAIGDREVSGLRVRMTPGLAKLVEERIGRAQATVSLIPLDALLPILLKGVEFDLEKRDIATCRAEALADAVMADLEGPAPAADDDQGGDGDPPPPTGKVDVGAFVAGRVSEQMASASAPESQLRFDVPSRSTQAERETALESFELRHGPSDVTSYHDFSSLQIAFDSVWTELFDDELTALGTQLYYHYAKLKDFTGGKEPPDAITSLEDLAKLMLRVESVLAVTAEEPDDSNENVDESKPAEKFEPVGTGSVVVVQKAPPGMVDRARLTELLTRIQAILSTDRYVFDVFAPDSYNFGVMVTYRQTWVPLNYQTGDLVATIPLAPKEVRRYSTRTVTKKSRARKEVENNLVTRRTEASDTERVDSEIVKSAQDRTNFNLTASETFGQKDSFSVEMGQQHGGDSSKTSSKTKKDFHESVRKSAQEFRSEHRVEVTTNESTEFEATTAQELQNPNDELTVTYAFWELQRQFRITEAIHSITPVILVANDVPAPHEIDDAWLIEHDWILGRMILDDSFRPALDYLRTSFVGAEVNIRLLTQNMSSSRQLVQDLKAQIQSQERFLAARELDVKTAIDRLSAQERSDAGFNLVKGVFDPAGITGKADTGAADAEQTKVDYAKAARDLAERERERLMARLDLAVSALQAAVDKLSSAIREHYDNLAQVDRLRVHVKDNILYYMQAIWSHEPPDQRFFRLYDIPIDEPIPDATGVKVAVEPSPLDELWRLLQGLGLVATVPMPQVKFQRRKLVDVADLDEPLGYKGNYAIFPLKQNNVVTLHMMQDYLELSDELRLRDPDEFSDLTVEDLREFATCLRDKNPNAFKNMRTKIRDELIKRYTAGETADDLVVVPTNSLYIDAIVGTHPLLEDFKLIHRALDVKKVQAEVRHQELENIRLAARALKGNEEDPDIDRQIVVTSDHRPTVIVPADGG